MTTHKEADSYLFRLLDGNAVKYLRSGVNVSRDDFGELSRITGYVQDVTEKITSAVKLKEANDELTLLLNRIGDVLFSRDVVNGKFIQISDTTNQLLGYAAAEFMDNPDLWITTIHPDDRHIVTTGNARLAQGNQITNRYRIIRKSGVIRWVENTIVPTMNEEGELLRIDAVIRDITDSVAADDRLRRSEERYRQIVETSHEGIWTADEHNKLTFFNQRICNLLEYTAEELQGKDFFDLVDENGKHMIVKQAQNDAGHSNENYDVKFISKTGKDVWASLSTSSLHNDSGKYIGMLAMVTDITQRKLNEEALIQSEANLRTLFDNTDISYVRLSENMDIVSFNKPALQHFQKLSDKMLEPGYSIFNYFPYARRNEIYQYLKRIQRGPSVNYEYSISQNEGSLLWFEAHWVKITSTGDQKNRGYILSKINITERKKALLEHERFTAELVRRNRTLEEFTYIVSHNLRAPVANIIGLSQMLEVEDDVSSHQQSVIEKILSSVDKLDNMVRDLNMVLQVREKMSEKMETVNLNDVMVKVEVSLQALIAYKKTKIVCDFKHADELYSISNYVQNIFWNLVQNSIKYCYADTQPVITIKTNIIDDLFEITFTDNGRGIDLEKNGPTLFGLYRRYDKSGDGRGMGLFMVKTQVEALGGSIHVKSELDKGTEFCILLPIPGKLRLAS
ncbi:PAS domain S-box protein [Mucilaginibacter terrae]